MFRTKKIALGLAGGAIVLGSGLGMATLANADTTNPTTTPAQAQTWQHGGQGRMGASTNTANATAGLGNGGGYGAVENADYLAGKLGVTPEAVTAALQKYHAANPSEVRGRDLGVDQQAAEHAKLAAFLAGELNVSEATVLDALNTQQDVRRAERTQALLSTLSEN